MFSTLLIVCLLAWNTFVSWANAASAGAVWRESRAVGGFPRLLAWATAVQSACGFTLLIVVALAFALGGLHLIPPKVVELLMEFSYLAIIVPLLGSGLIILIQSWRAFFMEKSIGNLMGAAYNTYAMVSNTMDAAREIPSIFDHVGKLFSGDSDSDSRDGVVVFFAIALVAVAVLGGVGLTLTIMRRHMRAGQPVLRADVGA